MATGYRYDRKEFQKQMQQLEQQFSRMCIEDQGQRIGEMPHEKEKITQDSGKTKLLDTHLKNRLYEPRHRVPHKGDDKDFFIGLVRARTAALFLPLSSVIITPFEGDPRNIQHWNEEVEKSSVMIMNDQQYKYKSDQVVESGSDETFESEQCENRGQDYEIPLTGGNVPNVPLDEDMEIDEILPLK